MAWPTWCAAACTAIGVVRRCVDAMVFALALARLHGSDAPDGRAWSGWTHVDRYVPSGPVDQPWPVQARGPCGRWQPSLAPWRVGRYRAEKRCSLAKDAVKGRWTGEEGKGGDEKVWKGRVDL